MRDNPTDPVLCFGLKIISLYTRKFCLIVLFIQNHVENMKRNQCSKNAHSVEIYLCKLRNSEAQRQGASSFVFESNSGAIGD